MRSSLKALRSLETIKIFCSNENNNTSLCSRSLMTLFFLFFLSLVLLKIIMFLGVKLRKRSKKWQRKQAAFFSKNRRRDKKVINSQQSSFHTKKKEKNSNHRHFSSWRRVLPPRTTPRSRRYSSRYITKIEVCALHSARAFAFFLFFSLSTEEDRGKSSSTHFVDEITSLTDKLFFSLSLCINIIKITDAWRFPI